MSTKWTIGRRTLLGFIAIIILAGLGGAFAVYNFRQFEGELDLLRGTNKKLVDTTVNLRTKVHPLSNLNSQIRSHTDNAVRHAQVLIASRQIAESELALDELLKAKQATQNAQTMAKDSGKDEIAKAMHATLEGLDSYNQAVKLVALEINKLTKAQADTYAFCQSVVKLSKSIAKGQQLHLLVELQTETKEVISNRMQMITKTQETEQLAYQIQIGVDAFLRQGLEEQVDSLDLLLMRANSTITMLLIKKNMFSPVELKQLNEANEAFQQTKTAVGALVESMASLAESLEQMKAKQQSIEQTIAQVDSEVQALSDQADEDVASLSNMADAAMASCKVKLTDASFITMAIVGATLLVGLLLAMVLTRGLVRSVGGMADQLSFTADNVTRASSRLNDSSNSLAEGATGQAASLEETSASLEELASMTKNNADNAGQAQSLMAKTEQVGQEANEAMRGLSQSMQEISTAGAEIERIIKTIDEIAFQTNLLALNAAVEAARAGEAGAGFAVVADEVRSLALRAAEAASETQGLIQNTMSKVSTGTGALETTEAKFGSLLESTQRVASLVSEIASASQEQNQGIGQINSAMNQIDKVTQDTAALAQESSNGATELLQQADKLHEMLQGLLALTGRKQSSGGGAKTKSSGGSRPAPAKKAKPPLLENAKATAKFDGDDPDFESF